MSNRVCLYHAHGVLGVLIWLHGRGLDGVGSIDESRYLTALHRPPDCLPTRVGHPTEIDHGVVEQHPGALRTGEGLLVIDLDVVE